MCENVKSDLFFKHSLICCCVGNCNIAHAGWLGVDSMKEVDVKHQGCNEVVLHIMKGQEKDRR